MIEKIEKEHLILRKARESDLYNIWNNVWRDEQIAAAMLWQPTYTIDEAEERLRRTICFQQTFDAFFVCLKENDEAVGFCGVKEEAHGVFEECGICVAQKCQNKGYGKEITTALVKLAFEQLGGTKFVYGCFHENARSAAVCKALGFKYSHSRDEVRKWDGYEYTADYYELDKAEWRGQRKL